MHAIFGTLDAIFLARLRQRRRGEQELLAGDNLIKNQAEFKSAQVATKYHSYKIPKYWYRVRTLLIIILSVNCFDDFCSNREPLNKSDGRSLIHPTMRLTKRILQVVILVSAAADSYADASAESPSIDALEDEDDDDEELDASASNEYPDGDNDNDESYEDSDDDRQESRITENWLAPPVLLISHQRPDTDYERFPSIRNATTERHSQ